MLQRPLGRSGVSASVVGLGAWAMGGWMWGGTDAAASIRAIHAALDAGINLIDTAPIYGFGVSESIVGRAIHDRRERVVLATKCAMVCDPHHGHFKFRSTAQGPDPHGHIEIHIYAGPESIRQEVEESLHRLQTDYIDLYQTHWQDPTTPIADTMGTLLELKQEGKIRAIGVCNATVEQMNQYRAVGPLDSDQERYSLLARDIEQNQMPFCRENGVAMLAYSPLALGLLSGKIGPERQFIEGDLRRSHPLFTVESRQRVEQLLRPVREIAQARGVTVAQVVTAWTFHQPGMSHVLCGARNPEQARENATAGDLQLTAEELHAIGDASRQ